MSEPSAGLTQVECLAEPTVENERSYRNFNLFNSDDLALFWALARGEWEIRGLRNAT